jgi:hypothetical protein
MWCAVRRSKTSIDETRRGQFRAECFNLLNHPNSGPPENDVESSVFGQILLVSSRESGRQAGMSPFPT